MISSWHSSLFTACIIALLHSSTFAAGNGKDSLLHDYLVKYCTYKNIPSIAAGMNVQGNTVWMDATGLADIENNVPATVNSVYRVASVSKVITSVAVMQLVEAGKIKLDEDVRTYIPQYPRKRWKFTIRQVLEHTSGLRTYKDGEFDSKTPFRNSTEVLNYLAADTLMYEPGTKYLYSSLSFNLLASVIESVTGMPFTQYMQKNIFDRADMRQTCYDEVAKIVPNRVAGYDKNGLRAFENAPLADLSIKFPGGGVLSTVPDLLKFGHALLSGKFFS
ncbi:MAG: beta-lactamase family protein, partial [Ignavibacteria bacterium]|nr:beta-lactamase family protein [Ignavibacteria bacterium]